MILIIDEYKSFHVAALSPVHLLVNLPDPINDEIKYIIITAVSGLPDASSLNNIHTKLVINKDSKTVLTYQDDCKITALASGALKLEFNGLDFNVNKNWSLEVSY
jgi:hypothetical protein